MAILDLPPGSAEVAEPFAHARELLLSVREAVAEVIDHPSATGVRAIVTATQRMVRFEVEALLPVVDHERRDRFEQSHEDLAGHLNILSWHGPGSKEMSDAVADFRHVLLAHLDLLGRR